jgi:hypothetical protein
VPHFQLVTADGEALGPVGSVIYRGGDEPNLRLVGELEADDDDPEVFRVLIVEPS